MLSSLRGVFTLQTDYDVHEAATPKEALRHVERARVDVVISDFLMPEMNGIELLKEIKRLQPEAIRLLLTGYADKENAIKAINESASTTTWKNRGTMKRFSTSFETRFRRKDRGASSRRKCASSTSS